MSSSVLNKDGSPLSQILPNGLLGSQRFRLFVLLASMAALPLFVATSALLTHPGGHIARFTAILTSVASASLTR
ncbi:MAG TPA: hypothetical protein VGN34_09985 [Ktedonobacteraceae bacterium]|jgi:hypothetical protein